MEKFVVLIVILFGMMSCSEATKVEADDACLSNGGKSYKWNNQKHTQYKTES